MRNICENVSSGPNDLFCRSCWNDSACSPLPDTTTQLFSESLSSRTLCSCLEILSTTNNLYNFWHSKFQQINTHPFCCWDDIFTQKWSCSSPNNFCNCTESPPMLSTNTSIEWKLYLSWSNHLITSFSLKMIVWGISEHQYKTIDTERYDGCFFTARVSEVNMNKLKKSFEQWSELQVVKCLINHVLFSSYNVSNLELWNEKKQGSNKAFVLPATLYSIRSVYIMRECVRTRS